MVNLAASLGHGPYALGYQTAFDSGKSALTKHNLALNYNAGDMILHATSSDFKVTLPRCCYCVFTCKISVIRRRYLPKEQLPAGDWSDMQQRHRRSLKLCYRLQVRAGQGREPQGQGGHQQSGETIDSLASPSTLTRLSLQIGLSYQQKLREGIVVTVSTNLDGTKLNQPGHKLGLCLEMSA